MSKLDDLRAVVEAMTDGPPWRQGSFEKYNLFVHDIDSLGGTAGDRVLLRANTHYPYVENLAGIVALRNAAPALLDLADAVKAWRDRRALNLMDALGPAGEDRDDEPIEVRRARVRRTADAARAVELALDRLEDLP